MLRLVSVIGIAIAMVVGFVAISTQMKDDFSVRSRVVDIIKQMKDVAAEELQCAPKGQNSTSTQPDIDSENPDTTVVEINSELEMTPLVDESSDIEKQQPDMEATNNLESEKGNTVAEPDPLAESLEQPEVDRNSDIIQALGYRLLDNGIVEVIMIFNNVRGESGKIRVKAGSRLVINCSCLTEKMSCKTVSSNINKNYLPKKLTKQ